MTSIIYGFIIAIWIVLNFIFFRLGLILKELEELNSKQDEEVEDG